MIKIAQQHSNTTRTVMRLTSTLKHRIVCLGSFLPAENLSHPCRKRIAAPVQVRVTTLCNMILQEEHRTTTFQHDTRTIMCLSSKLKYRLPL